MIDQTTAVWTETLWEARNWNCERDTLRIESTFRALARECSRWPTPQQFLESLPPSQIVKPLPALRKPASEAVAKTHIDKIKKLLGITENDGETSSVSAMAE